MISKKYRLSEKEVKKVLKRWKPFFSYWLVLNYLKNNLEKNRFAIVIWAKTVKNNVERNFFRRKFYNLVKEKVWDLYKNGWIDYVFVVKKQINFDIKDEKIIKSYENDIKFLLNKI